MRHQHRPGQTLPSPGVEKDGFHKIHNVEHPGVKKSKELVAEKFVWVAMKEDIG